MPKSPDQKGIPDAKTEVMFMPPPVPEGIEAPKPPTPEELFMAELSEDPTRAKAILEHLNPDEVPYATTLLKLNRATETGDRQASLAALREIGNFAVAEVAADTDTGRQKLERREFIASILEDPDIVTKAEATRRSDAERAGELSERLAKYRKWEDEATWGKAVVEIADSLDTLDDREKAGTMLPKSGEPEAYIYARLQRLLEGNVITTSQGDPLDTKGALHDMETYIDIVQDPGEPDEQYQERLEIMSRTMFTHFTSKGGLRETAKRIANRYRKLGLTIPDNLRVTEANRLAEAKTEVLDAAEVQRNLQKSQAETTTDSKPPRRSLLDRMLGRNKEQ